MDVTEWTDGEMVDEWRNEGIDGWRWMVGWMSGQANASMHLNANIESGLTTIVLRIALISDASKKNQINERWKYNINK